MSHCNIFILLNFFHATSLLLLLSLLSFAAFVTLIKQAQQEILWETSLDSKMRQQEERTKREKKNINFDYNIVFAFKKKEA